MKNTNLDCSLASNSLPINYYITIYVCQLQHLPKRNYVFSHTWLEAFQWLDFYKHIVVFVCVHVSHSVVSDFLPFSGLCPTRLLCPWNSQGKNEYWSGYPFPFPGDFPNPRIKPRSPTLQTVSFTIWATREAWMYWEDPEGWDGEGGRRGDRDGEHM